MSIHKLSQNFSIFPLYKRQNGLVTNLGDIIDLIVLQSDYLTLRLIALIPKESSFLSFLWCFCFVKN